MRLLFRKNKYIRYSKHSGQLCPGFENCIYPGSVKNSEIKGFKDEPVTIIPICQYLEYTGPMFLDLSFFTREEFKDYQKKFNCCFHPNELKMVGEWRCYKCNNIVDGERDRHKCYD